MTEPRTTLASRLAARLFDREINHRVDLALAALDDTRDRLLRPIFAALPLSNTRDRPDGERLDLLRQSLEAWRTNPLARRIVELTSQYVVGGGIGLDCRHQTTRLFLQEFWEHPLNRMDSRIIEWCDELTRSGELFILITTDPAGMSYVRAIPATDMAEISCEENDLEQETRYVLQDGRSYRGRSALTDTNGLPPFILHYAINRPVGALHGESDLAPLLKWLARYSGWLEDRARLNRFRTTFLYAVTLKGSTSVERRKRQAELNLNPPSPGSLLVKDEAETWETLSPRLESSDANEDGLALKKMIAAGAGIPLHFLAEPESSTRTTAESAGGPTFRHYEQRQEFVLWMLRDVLQAVCLRAVRCGRSLDPKAAIEIRGTDISARDNSELAGAASQIVSAFSELHSRGLIDDAELLRLAYRFAGEVVDIPALLQQAVDNHPKSVENPVDKQSEFGS
ncbi:hypothetical protein [Leptolinea tardivitalis]|uniref:Portal protein n=1 Tax=Leptolinea tardivitalis TaxID=229920 RepID=A0A0P6WLE6_9CHLR|nr:hypothetical protein [Leptolinea tardivitalis]KPL70619.1 hypothetical protein ADM99_16080 [Leptolinea tardivitalis]GAP22239.1 hypothetical protein LTAR_02464 [Leptolinea tardivitalis]